MVFCLIKLDNNDKAIVHAGELLKGSIEFFAAKPMQLQGLYFVVFGEAKCHWTEEQTKVTGALTSRRRVIQLIHFRGQDIYLNQQTYLLGSSCGDLIESVKAGTHRYNYSCQLPSQLPGSCETKYGFIRYHVEAAVVLPGGFVIKANKLRLNVVRHNDLNDHPLLKVPIKTEKSNCFWCIGESLPLTVKVTLPCTGYVPEQVIPFTVNYENESNIDIVRTKISLKRVINFHAETPCVRMRSEAENIASITIEGVKKKSKKNMDVDLVIPKLSLKSNNRFCKIIEISYKLKVEVEPRGLHDVIKMEIPIVIGSVPLDFHLDQNHIPESVPLAVPASIDEPPPTFQEAMEMCSLKQ